MSEQPDGPLPPAAKRVPTERRHHGDTVTDEYAWLTAKDDQEQHIRAKRLESLGIVELLHPETLAPYLLATKIVRMLIERQAPFAFDMNGASNTANILRSAVAARRERPGRAAK